MRYIRVWLTKYFSPLYVRFPRFHSRKSSSISVSSPLRSKETARLNEELIKSRPEKVDWIWSLESSFRLRTTLLPLRSLACNKTLALFTHPPWLFSPPFFLPSSAVVAGVTGRKHLARPVDRASPVRSPKKAGEIHRSAPLWKVWEDRKDRRNRGSRRVSNACSPSAATTSWMSLSSLKAPQTSRCVKTSTWTAQSRSSCGIGG